MPRAKVPKERDVLVEWLADALGVGVLDILTRAQVVSQYGVDLGYTNQKSLSNAEDAVVPCFYLAPLGRKGIALYSRQDIRLWLHDPKARRAMELLGEKGRPHPWPTVVSGIPKPSGPTRADTEAGLAKITDDKAYMDMVLGRTLFPPPTPEEMEPDVIGSGWRSKRGRSAGSNRQIRRKTSLSI